MSTDITVLQKLLSHVPGMVYQFKRSAEGTFTIPFTTDQIKDIFGCSPEEVATDFSPVSKVILPEDLPKVIASVEESAKNMTTWKFEYRVQLPGQPIKWLLGNSTPEKLDDGSIVWSGFNTDITEQKNIEQQLKQKITEYELINSATINREIKMVELKNKIKDLELEMQKMSLKT